MRFTSITLNPAIDRIEYLDTLTENGSVSRGECFVNEDGMLTGVTERTKIEKDGEGASKLLECRVDGAMDSDNARIVAKSIICSSLVKAAMFGSDANWGRVLCAIGYSGADVDVTKISVAFVSRNGTVKVCENGAGIDFSEELAKQVLSDTEIRILIGASDGNGHAVAWGCDLTYDYVKINGDYRT